MNFCKYGGRKLRVGSCILDTGKQCVVRDPRSFNAAGAAGTHDSIQLTPRDFKVLQTLIDRSPDLVMRSELLAAAWQNKVVCENVVYQSIGRLRTAFGDTPSQSQYIATVSKRGYRLVASVTQLPANKPVSQTSVDASLAPVLIAPFENLNGSEFPPEFMASLSFEVGHQLIGAGIGVMHMESEVPSAVCKDRYVLAEQLGAQTLMDAAVLANATRVRVMVKLTETDSRLQIWSARYDFPVEEIFDMQCLLAESAVADICLKLSERLGPRAAPRHAEQSNVVPATRLIGLK